MITSNSLETESLLSKQKISSADNDEIVNSQNLSSTIRKLCMWEKKLYDEVKVWSRLLFCIYFTFSTFPFNSYLRADKVNGLVNKRLKYLIKVHILDVLSLKA